MADYRINWGYLSFFVGVRLIETYHINTLKLILYPDVFEALTASMYKIIKIIKIVLIFLSLTGEMPF